MHSIAEESKMPSEQQKTSANQVISAQPEKPFHYTYLKEFRTQQCQDFLQHKCPHHRPFTCFHWHFLNQRRRRPIRKRDGTFNYSPDIYCSKYDETSGLCEDRDDCPYLHRNTGDTERRYHLRYYKTGTCVHETDARGHCVKNGPHCAFAHGPHDLRQPVYDIREMAQTKPLQGPPTCMLPTDCPTSSDAIIASLTANPLTTQAPTMGQTSLVADKDKTMYVDDPRWQDTNFVLANYKTEPCNKPPRLCRQGYACPRFHNARDRRRNPRKFKYRSTPCPNVKIGDEWGDPSNCEQSDNCQYCHTRTDQQFHPEIYKSTKCNDMQQTGFCPRGPFCAFAHVDQEMSDTHRELTEDQTSLAQISPVSSASSTSNQVMNPSLQSELCLDFSFMQSNVLGHLGGGDASSMNSPGSSGLGPIGKPRSNSASSSYSSVSESSSYHRSHNAEKDDNSNLFYPACSQIPLTTNSATNSFFGSTMSANAQPFYPTSDTVESVIGNALDELNMDDFDVAAIDKELDNDNSSIGSSTTSLGHLPMGLSLGTSAPVNIPTSTSLNHKSSMPESPASPLSSQLPPAFVPQHIQQQQHQQQQIEQAAAAFMSQPNTVPSNIRHMGLGHILGDPMGPTSASSGSATQGTSAPRGGGHNHTGEGEMDTHRLQEEITALRSQVQKWEETWVQAKQACDAWKREATESQEKAKHAELEKNTALQRKEEAFNESRILKQEIEGLSGGPHLHVLNKASELYSLPLPKLKQLQSQLKVDLERVEKILHIRENFLCCICQERERSVVVGPCQHLVLCASCASACTECPVCHKSISSKTNVVVPAPL
ncbi:putative E3 ubiquitin-protein ligase UNKL isoform X1 [Diadema setosum]|uniref:putative E3 ubiquitin-protein ligase UNKL isoform X1 n=1 Tax=Diadema setosum TaxID=31175 RepID=UPI003B3AFEF1